MNYLFQQRFFRLLSECLQHQVPASELIKAIEELATHIADFSMNEQDYNILLRYFSFGLYRLKSYRVRFEQEKNTLSASNRWSDRTFEHRNSSYRMAHQVPGTVAATHQQTSPFPSLSRWQNNPYQHHGNGKRSVPLQRHRISERQTRLLGGLIQSLWMAFQYQDRRLPPKAWGRDKTQAG